MDEPTNHLDIISKDVLKKALIKYDGTLIIISHDRDFLQGLSSKIFEFKNKNIKESLGDVNTFLEEKALENLDDLNKTSKKIDKKIIKVDSIEKISYQKRKELDKNIRITERKISKLEEEISILEEKKKELDIQLSDPIKYKEIIKEKNFFKIYDNNNQNIVDMENDWDVLVKRLNELKIERNS